MGLFDFFKSKNENYDIETLLLGYFRLEISKLIGCEVNSKEFADARKLASEGIKAVLVPVLNKNIQQEVANTISSVCKNRFNEVFGEYMLFFFYTVAITQKGVSEGLVKAEDASTDVINLFIHAQIKDFIAKAKNRHS
jgi:hypothetical protein